MKRLLSLILAISMLFSLAPAITAGAEGEQAYRLVYHFTQVDEFRNAAPYCNKVGSSNFMIPENVTFEGTYGMWAFHEQNGIDGWDTNQAFQYRKNYSEIKTNGEGSYFAVKINVPYASEYTADLRYYQYKGSGVTNADVYLVSGNTANVASPTEGEKVADIAKEVPFVISSGASDYQDADTVSLSLSEGEYILVFYVTTPATGNSSANRIRPVSLTLTSGSGDAYATVPAYINKAEIAKTTLEAGESTSYEFSGRMNDYSAFDEASAGVAVTSKNGCVSIDASAKSITAQNGGDDVITFSVTSGGKTITKQVEISVSGSSQNPDEPGGDENESDDEDGKVRYEYNLNLGIENYTNTTGYAANVVTDYATSKDTWIYHAKTAGTAYGYLKKYIEIKSDVGEYFAIKMKVPRDGIYDVSLTQYLHAANGGYIDLYLLPGDTGKEDIPGLLVEGNKLNEEAIRGFADANTQDSVSKLTSGREIAAGEYVLVFHAASLGDNGSGTVAWMYPATITLEGVPTAEEPEKIYRLVFDKPLIRAGETSSVKEVYTDVGEKAESFSIGSVASETAHAVISDGMTITATGNAFGYEKITATVIIDGKEYKSEGYIRIVDKRDSGVRVSHALDTRNNNADGEEWINPSYIKDPSRYNTISSAKYDICGLEKGHGITKEYTDGWSWYGCSSDITVGYDYFRQLNESYLRLRLANGQWCAFDFDIDKTGHYRASINHLAFKTYGDSEVYLIPMPEKVSDVEKYLTDAYKIGEFSCKNEDVAAWDDDGAAISTYLGDAYVDSPGRYVLVFKKISGSNFLYVNDVILSGGNPIVEIKKPDRAMRVGDTLNLGKHIISWEAEFPQYTDNCTMSYENRTPDIISVDENGIVTALSGGVAEVAITAKWGVYEHTAVCSVVVGSVKNRRSFYTDEKVEALYNNLERYGWAKKERDAYVKAADELLGKEELLYDMITTQELPRTISISYRFRDNGAQQCLYCEKELYTEYGERPWKMNIFARPWKIQCPDCRRLFPSNDFGKFYELGIDEHGNYRFALALQRHHEKFVCKDGENCGCTAPAGERGSDEWNSYYGYGVKGGYLCNDLYSEKNDSLFAVDDGWGYEFTYTYKNEDGTPVLNEDGTEKTELRCKPFIAFYNYYGVMYDSLGDWIEKLSMAYLYTGEEKYGRVALVLLDRLADVYPEFDTTECGDIFSVGDGNSKKENQGTSRGRIFGKLMDTRWIRNIILAYDAVYPLLSDPWVISFLSGKAEEYGLANPKKSAVDIAMNIENNILREVNTSIRDFRMNDNFGSPQTTHIYASIVLDTFPETQEWIEFVFKSGGKQSFYEYTGGEVNAQLINVIDRDGHGTEAAPGYNYIWVKRLMDVADAVNEYDRISGMNLYDNPKFIRMLTSLLDIELVSNAAPNIGDHDRMGRHMSAIELIDTSNLIKIYETVEDEETKKNIARVIYRKNGKTTDGLHGSIFSEEPEAVISGIKEAIADGIEIKLPSIQLAGYGISILRAGDWFDSMNPARNVNTQRDFYIWYGNTSGHGDLSKLTLNFHAYGLAVGDDIGEARLKDDSDPHRTELQEHTVAHNTVTVNGVAQKATLDGNAEHFDDSGRVRIMDAEAPEVYAAEGVEEYKRTLVMVDADDDISYAVDFFHVIGGEDHLYSFHALAMEAELSGNVLTEGQTDENGNYIGSYQGIDKAWGSSNIKGDDDGLGTYSWFGEVNRATNPENVDMFSMDWKIIDNDGVLKPAQNDLRVRLTMLNSFRLDEITTTSCIPPQVYNALPTVPFLFARHTGKNDGRTEGEKLDTLFTSVVEPYNKTRYIENIEKVNISRADGKSFVTDEAKAVKVTLTNGRVDYIVYAKDTTVPYKVHYKTSTGADESFDFCGYIGVVSMSDDKIIYTYINDGTTIADKTELTPAYTGEVEDFSRELTFENYIDVKLGQDVEDVTTLSGKYIYVDNTHVADNAGYLIERAEKTENGARLYLGNTTLITGYVDDYDFDKGYKYNVMKGQSFRIPLSHVEDSAPVFDEVKDNLSTSAGSSVSETVNAESPLDEDVRYKAVTLPRGAMLDEASGAIVWNPSASQIGKNLFRIEATDECGRVSRVNFMVTVYGSTTGGTSGGAGGGGGAPAPTTPTEPEKEPEKEPAGEDVILPPAERFVDLGNHAWARDAINALADAGIIKGTSENTFSPANNITRADFTILLVRAFELKSDNTENFSDVAESDYYARELAIARNTGIVNGIGDNKYAPRNQITRQDMMTIVYRALNSLPLEGKVAPQATDEVDVADFDTVADYAKEAVSALVTAGIVNGKNGLIAPTDYTTRAEVAVLIKRILDYTK